VVGIEASAKHLLPCLRRWGLVALGVSLSSGAVAEVSFNREIRPILSDRCFACHGPDGGTHGEKWKGGLRLDTEEGARADLVTAKHATQTATRAAKGLPVMPRPDGSRFAIVPGKPEASLLVGRIMSTDEDEIMPPPDSHLSLSAAEKELLTRWIAEGAQWDGHWAFQTLQVPSPPELAAATWPRTGVDRFVLARLEEKGLAPAPEAARPTWLRRVTQDLTGLPPTIAEIEAFTADQSPDAERTVVNRLLQSVDYAERMTAVWLDNARYADSNGFQFDNARTMWPWRDWVIEAFRGTMSYDRFVTEQLAGDLLENPTPEQLIATGFNRNHGYSIEGGIIDEEYRVLYANDKTTTAGTLFLGLTMECTRCHDHKYDPLTMADYYSFYAFFNTSAERGAPGENGRKQKAAPPFITHESKDAKAPKTLVMVMEEKPRKSHVLGQGLFDQPGEEVTARTPEVLPPFDGYPGNRLGLAQWLTAAENPLFARVTVNRLWQQFFGVGLVDTPDNFGMQGGPPSHPLLLDWLALKFRRSGWDLHHLIRQIVLSATYRQSSDYRPDLQDPDSRLLARGPSFRLPAEMIRDQALAIGGLMTREVGGPSVKPYQPDGVWGDLNAPKSHAEVYVPDTGPALYRKSLYTYWRRAVPHPAMATFDAPSRDVCSVERESTNTPLQALVTLHGPTYIEATRCLAEACLGMPDPLGHAFRSILSRPPRESELRVLRDLHATRLAHYEANPEAAARLLKVGATPADAQLDAAQVAALADVCHAILNLSESITRK
jgi:hypothetical protein